MLSHNPHVEPCIHEVACTETLEEMMAVPTSNDTAFDYAGLRYGTELTFDCGSGRVLADLQKKEQKFSCGWDKSWSPSDQVAVCQCEILAKSLRFLEIFLL